jgi:hypothetical protein
MGVCVKLIFGVTDQLKGSPIVKWLSSASRAEPATYLKLPHGNGVSIIQE